jgi:hypothetical protein
VKEKVAWLWEVTSGVAQSSKSSDVAKIRLSKSLVNIQNHGTRLMIRSWSRIAFRYGLSINTTNAHNSVQPMYTRLSRHLLLLPLINIPPTMPATTAAPPMMAIPISPSLFTFSSINCLRLPACRFPGSRSMSVSLNLRASA